MPPKLLAQIILQLKHVAATAFMPFLATGDSPMDLHVAIVVGFMCKSHQKILIKILMQIVCIPKVNFS